MKAIILAAGRGTRLKPLTDSTPKCLVEVNGKPLLDRAISELSKTEVEEIIIVVGYLGSQISSRYSDFCMGKKITYIHQESLNGTGGAVLSCKDYIADDFMVIFGDGYFEQGDIISMYQSVASPVIGVIKEPSPQHYGVIEVNKNYEVIGIEEKPEFPRSNWIVAGIYILNIEILKILEKTAPSVRGEIEIPSAISTYLCDNKIWARPLNGMYDIGTIERLADVNLKISKGLLVDY